MESDTLEKGAEISRLIEIGRSSGIEEHILNFWEEKKIIFIKLKLWEDERSDFYIEISASRHRVLLENILSRILSKATISKESNLAIGRYLKERALSNLAYVKALEDQLIYLPSPSTRTEPNLLKASLASVSSFQSALSSKLKDFSYKIENDLLHSEFVGILIDYDSHISETRSKVVALTLELEKLNYKASKLFTKHSSNFANIEISVASEEEPNICLWLSEWTYLHYARAAFKLQKVFVSYVHSLWSTIRQLETKRVKSIKSMMGKYIQMHKELFVIETTEVEIGIQEINEDLSNSFTPDKLLTAEEEEFIKKFGGDGQDSFERLLYWKLPFVEQSDMVLLEGQLIRETTVFRQWESCYAVLTKDRFLHLFNFDIKEEHSKPLLSCHLLGATILVSSSQEELFFEIIENRRTGLFQFISGPRRTMLKSESFEELEKWVKNIKSLI